MDTVKVRSFRQEDLQAAEDLAHEAWKPIFTGFREQISDDIFDQTRPDPESKRTQIRHFAKEHPEWFIVAEDSAGNLVGFACYFLNFEQKIGIIGNNAVDKTRGLKGVGQALYAELFRRFKEAGMTLAQVTTGLDEGHAPARRAYQRAGFGEFSLESVTYYKKLV